MATEQRDVKILAWPEGPATLEHKFSKDSPCPVSIRFGTDPANVAIMTTPEHPLNVDMDMHLSTDKPVPICIKICEPICVKSEYVIGIDIFDRPVGTISLKGLTRIFNCREEQVPEVKKTCVDFSGLKEPMEIKTSITYESLVFAPIGNPLRIRTFGEPEGRPKMTFPPEGMRITFPFPVKDVDCIINNYAGNDITVSAYSDSTLLGSTVATIHNEVKTVSLNYSMITSAEIKGGNNESGLVQVCYYS